MEKRLVIVSLKIFFSAENANSSFVRSFVPPFPCSFISSFRFPLSPLFRTIGQRQKRCAKKTTTMDTHPTPYCGVGMCEEYQFNGEMASDPSDCVVPKSAGGRIPQTLHAFLRVVW